MLLQGDDDLSDEDKLGLDDGKSSLKLTMSFCDPHQRQRLVIKTGTSSQNVRGIGVAQTVLNSRINKIFFLAIAPKYSREPSQS